MSTQIMFAHSRILVCIRLLLICSIALSLASANEHPKQLPELDEILAIIHADKPPEGVVFTLYEYEEDALEWVVPRLSYYVDLLRERYQGLPIAVVSHGDEILSLTTEQRSLYKGVHKALQKLVKMKSVSFHICGTYAAYNGLSEQDFPDYIDVVPFGPSQIANYERVGYQMIELGLTW